AINPRDRYQSMTEFASALGDVRQRLQPFSAANAGEIRRHVRVVVRRHGGAIWTGKIDKDELTIGRDPESDVVLDDPNVTWLHATLRRDRDGALWFADRSANGSFFNGRRVETAALGYGGLISIKPYDLDISVPEAPEPHPLTVSAAGDIATEPADSARLRFLE